MGRFGLVVDAPIMLSKQSKMKLPIFWGVYQENVQYCISGGVSMAGPGSVIMGGTPWS